MIRYLKEYENGKPERHPVGMTVAYPGGNNADLWNGPADWISPNGDLLPTVPADGPKVVIYDTDYLCGICGTVAWVWDRFLTGRNPIFMDPYNTAEEFGTAAGMDTRMRTWEPVRQNMGYALSYTNGVDLGAMIPHAELASSGYCLADPRPGKASYLMYFPEGNGTVNLASGGSFRSSGFDRLTGVCTKTASQRNGSNVLRLRFAETRCCTFIENPNNEIA